MIQLSLSDAALARDEAIEQVGQAADEEWKKGALHWLRLICVKRQEFTTDFLHQVLAKYHTTPDEKRVYGWLMKEGEKRGWCSRTDRTVNSKRKECHARPIRVWRSEIANEGWG